MLKRLSPRELLEQAAADWEPTIRMAWLGAITAIRLDIVLKRIIERLEKGDVAGAVRDLGIEDGVFARFEIALRQAYDAGGIATVSAMPSLRDPLGNRIVFSWGVRNLAGEAALREHAANLVTGMTQDMREGLRGILAQNLAEGASPHKAALNAVGRINRATGRREGGLLGLTSQQMRTAEWIRQAMRDGDAEKMRQYLGLKLRDKRFDQSVLKALRDGIGLSEEVASRIFARYSDRALDYRGKVIARHETMMALDKARDDAFRQQIDDGKVEAQDITKIWHHTARKNERVEHKQMQGQTVPFDQPFVAPDGTQLQYPRDPNAPASHTLNCFCRVEIKIDYAGALVRRHQEQIGG